MIFGERLKFQNILIGGHEQIRFLKPYNVTFGAPLDTSCTVKRLTKSRGGGEISTPPVTAKFVNQNPVTHMATGIEMRHTIGVVEISDAEQYIYNNSKESPETELGGNLNNTNNSDWLSGIFKALGGILMFPFNLLRHSESSSSPSDGKAERDIQIEEKLLERHVPRPPIQNPTSPKREQLPGILKVTTNCNSQLPLSTAPGATIFQSDVRSPSPTHSRSSGGSTPSSGVQPRSESPLSSNVDQPIDEQPDVRSLSPTHSRSSGGSTPSLGAQPRSESPLSSKVDQPIDKQPDVRSLSPTHSRSSGGSTPSSGVQSRSKSPLSSGPGLDKLETPPPPPKNIFWGLIDDGVANSVGLVNKIWSFANGTNRDIEPNPDGHSIEEPTEEAPSSASTDSGLKELIVLKRKFSSANKDLAPKAACRLSNVDKVDLINKELNKAKGRLKHVNKKIETDDLSPGRSEDSENLKKNKEEINKDLLKLKKEKRKLDYNITITEQGMNTLILEISKIKKEIEDLEQQRREAGLPVVM